MTLAPIVIFAYNRPDHLRRTLDALSKNDLASESVLYIFCDGKKQDATDEQSHRIAKNRDVAHQATGFKEVRVIERDHNIGLKDNIVSAVTEIVNQYGRIITLEDDIVTSFGFLRYMNDALELYAHEEKVMHISGYMWPHKGHLPETFFYEVPCPWGWATWQRAWKYYNDDADFLYHIWEQDWARFNKFGSDYLQKQLKQNYQGTISTWFIKWHAVLLLRNALTLYPHTSLVNNIGFDDDSTNCYATNKFDIKELAEYVEVKPIAFCENKKASRFIYDFYQGHWYNRRRRKALIRKLYGIITFWK